MNGVVERTMTMLLEGIALLVIPVAIIACFRLLDRALRWFPRRSPQANAGFVATMLIAVAAVVLAGTWMWTWRDLIDQLGWAEGWVNAPIGAAFLAGIGYVLLALRRTRRPPAGHLDAA